MKYLIECKNVIDVTKPPYNADNTGNIDCTKVLCKIFDDILMREAEGVWETWSKLEESGENDTYIGFESRINKDGRRNVIFPEYVPSSRIIYFPAGIYLVSDTVSYTIKNLKNIYHSKPFYELSRGIHIMGESKDSVVIRLADNSSGFGVGQKKPVISYTNAKGCCERECSNVSQMNTIEDITIDCGTGNPGAVGLRFVANNSGRIQNLKIAAEDGYCGIMTAVGTEASVSNIEINGFDYGMLVPKSSILILDHVDVSGNRYSGIRSYGSNMVCNNVIHKNVPLFHFEDGAGRYYVVDEKEDFYEQTYNNVVYTEKDNTHLRKRNIPETVRSEDKEDWGCVDDFGAVGDGKTDSTQAIQEAFNSGKSVILFGEGHYLINGEISVPASVKVIDFMFCDLFAGENLIHSRNGAVFCINEDSRELLVMENLYTFEQLHGHFRLIRHAARRDLVMSDLHTQTAAMYVNTVPGSKVYLDNCACTTGTYSQNAILRRVGHEAEYCYLIPFEFHGQSVYGRQINPERADVELLNIGSEILIDGFKVEGPGTAVKTIHGGTTQINIMSAAIGKCDAENALVETVDALTFITGMAYFGFDEASCYHIIFRENIDGSIYETKMDESGDIISKYGRRVNCYCSGSLIK